MRDEKNASHSNIVKLVNEMRKSRVDGFISFLTADDKRYNISNLNHTFFTLIKKVAIEMTFRSYRHLFFHFQSTYNRNRAPAV